MKKLITFLISVAITCLSAMEVCAFEPVKIAGLNAAYWAKASSRAFTLPGGETFNSGEVYAKPGDELILPLAPEAFTDSRGTPISREDLSAVYAYQLEQAKISVKAKAETGAQFLESITIQDSGTGGGAYISLVFTGIFPSVSSSAFDYIITLSQEGRRNGVEIRLSGMLSNPVIEALSGDEYIDLSSGVVAEAKAYIKNISVSIGCGVIIKSNFFESSRYYGICSVETSYNGLPLIAEYPEIEMVYNLQTIGLRNGNRECVRFDLGSRYYVYNAQGEYAGTSDMALRYSHKYYLSRKKLDMFLPPEI